MKKLLSEAGIASFLSPALTAAFSAGFDMICDNITSSMEDVFPLRAADPSVFELRARPYASVLPLETRREMLLSLNRISSCAKEDVEDKLFAAGIRGSIKENYQGGILIDMNSSSEERELGEYIVSALMPAHLPVFFNYSGQTWAELDGKERSFAAIDGRDLSWNEFSALTSGN